MKKHEFLYHPLYCSKFNKDLWSYEDCVGCQYGHEHRDLISCQYCEQKLDSKVKSAIIKGYKPDYLRVLEDKKSVTFVRGGGLGDVIRLTPVIKELKRQLPKLKVNIKCDKSFLEIFHHNPFIDNIFSSSDEVVSDRNNIVLNLAQGFKLEDHSVDGIADRLGIKLKDKTMFYKVTGNEETEARHILSELNVITGVLKVGISARANTFEKCPSQDFWGELYNMVRATYLDKLQLFFFGKEKPEMPFLGNSVLFFGYSIRETATLMNQMDLFIGSDSGLLYLAQALGMTTLGLFGVTPGKSVDYPRFDFIDKRAEVCDSYCYGKAPCKGIPGKCIQAITPEDVLKKISSILNLDLKKIKSGKHKTINIIITKAGIGDILTITPGLRQLKKRHPISRLNVITAPDLNTDLLRNNPFIDSIIATNDVSKYTVNADIYKDITYYVAEYEVKHIPNWKKSRIMLYSEAMGNTVLQDKTAVFNPTTKETDWAKHTAELFKFRTAIAIQPMSGERYKDWPVSYWEKLVATVKSYFPKSLFLNFDPKIEIEGTFSIKEDVRKVVTLLGYCDLIISPDSLFLHVAGMYKKPTIAIFGPSCYRTGYKNVILCQRLDMPCCPCCRNASMKCNPLPGKQLNKIEGEENSECLLKLSPELIFKKAKPLLKELCYENKRGSSNSRGKKRTVASP